ncbi:hypothetical protein [Gossypium barbadense]|uniref:Uncharacterized protein n=2 Tax=Gossypium TaxID=3633 RepID=A0A5J5ND70_GOSBA|nr:hypothetical protein [Gossypium barbadense]TYH19403.1 hypothetical protein ES288_A05G349000v1 [Gossypium darwinii]
MESKKGSEEVSCVFERWTLCDFWVAPGLDKVELDEVCSFHGLVVAAPPPFPPFIVAAAVAYAFCHYGDNIASSCGFSFVIKENNLEPELKWIIAWKNGPCNDNKVFTKIVPLSEDVDWDQIKCNLESENCGSKSCCHLSGIKAEAFIEPGVKTTVKAKLIKQ